MQRRRDHVGVAAMCQSGVHLRKGPFNFLCLQWDTSSISRRHRCIAQARYNSAEAVAARQAAADAEAAEESVAPVHDDNEWAIEVVPDDGDARAATHDGSASNGRPDGLAEGIEYSMPVWHIPTYVLCSVQCAARVR